MMFKNAFAPVVSRSVSKDKWKVFRKIQGTQSPRNIRTAYANTADKDVLSLFDPNRYILTHSTIIASVDTESVPDVELGEDLWEKGRRVTRLWDDYRITKDTEKYVNCCAPDTMVTMADGRVKSIQNVREGDYVLTHKGRARKVLKTYQRRYEGDMVHVDSQGMLHPLRVTPEHPVYVWAGNDSCVNCHQSITKAPVSFDHAVRRFYCSKECYYELRENSSDLIGRKDFTFKKAGDLRKSWDWSLSVAPSVKGDKTPFSKEVARLIGLFLAEGFYELDSRNDNERVGLVWAFHANEADTLGRFVSETLSKEWGASSALRDRSHMNAILITTKTNRPLVKFFGDWVLGSNAKTKYLSEEVFSLSEDLRLEILRGWLEGDGSLIVAQDALRMTGTSASLDMINQIYLLSLSLGLKPRLQEVVQMGRKRHEETGKVNVDTTKETLAYQISYSSEQSRYLSQGTYYEDKASQHHENQNISERSFVKGLLLHSINLTTHAYVGDVFNLEVDEDNSYIANGVITHNCNADAWERQLLLKTFWTFIGGYNYQEHIQDPELSKGILLDAVARDLGDTVYIDLLVATDRVHAQLARDIVSGKMKTMSMGCFMAGTPVEMGDGTFKAIESIKPGEKVVTVQGGIRPVVNTQKLGWDGEMVVITMSNDIKITCTPNHPILVKVMGDEEYLHWIEAGDLNKSTHRLVHVSDQNFHDIQSLSKYKFKGTVYDLEVEEDHTYTVSGFGVHNCSIQFSLCTHCGNVATDEDHMCTHIKLQKGDTFVDENGVERKIAELCGHRDVPDSVTFFEASWVEIPAFEGAHVRTVLYVPPDLDLDSSIHKAMAITSSQAPSLSTHESSWMDAFRQDVVVLSSTFGNRAAFSFGEDDAEEGGEEKEDKTYMEEVLDESKKLIKDKLKSDIKKELVEDLNKKDHEKTENQDPMPEGENTNDNIIHASRELGKIIKGMQLEGVSHVEVYHAALRYLTPNAKTSSVIPNRKAKVYAIMALDRMRGLKASSTYYAMLMKAESQGSFEKFAKICEIHLKRHLTKGERGFLAKRSQMLKEK